MTFSVAAILALLTGCAATPPATEPAAPTHHHELHLPPAGPTVNVILDGKTIAVPLESLPHDGTSAPLTALWKSAFPTDDVASLHFDLVGSDGFHPASRPPCVRLLTGAEIGAARIDVGSHDVSFDDTLKLPGCYRVKGVVTMAASR